MRTIELALIHFGFTFLWSQMATCMKDRKFLDFTIKNMKPNKTGACELSFHKGNS